VVGLCEHGDESSGSINAVGSLTSSVTISLVWSYIEFITLTANLLHNSIVHILKVGDFGLRAGRLGFYGSIPGIFLFTSSSRTALGPTQPPIQCVPGALSLGVKRPGREADHSPPCSAEVKEWVELYLHPQYAFMAWCSVKAQGQLYLYLLDFCVYRFCSVQDVTVWSECTSAGIHTI
jgi:hypothetical protein